MTFKVRKREEKMRRGAKPYSIFAVLLFSLSLLLFSTACSELEKPRTEPFYAQTAPPAKKEFRWSNGGMPKSFDPALAAAPPETDIVRAVFEGLTDSNSKTLEAIPAIAEKWSATEDFKTWTFSLRKDAKWSNGERVVAADFVRSWKRLAEMGERAPHYALLENITGAKSLKEDSAAPPTPADNINLLKPAAEPSLPILNANANTARRDETKVLPAAEKTPPAEKATKDKSKTPPAPVFGVEAVNEQTLKVSLIEPDKDFPQLVAHPVFRPIYGDGKDFEGGKLNAAIVTNGAFRIASVGQDGITLDRSDSFWAKDKVELERVRFVPIDSAEKALEAYRAGEVDAVTNSDFEPLALKLLTPYDDFKQKTHSALNFYEINRSRKPFDDQRVREALAIAIERERLTEVEMEDASKPALNFLPFDADKNKKLVQDKERAKELLAEAGFEDGEDFPVVRLVINRNETQQRIARAVVKMWKQTLNIDTVIIAKEASEIEAVRQSGEYDILRRGVVLPTADETAALMAIFAPPAVENSETDALKTGGTAFVDSQNADSNGGNKTPADEQTEPNPPAEILESKPILSEEQAIAEVAAIPLYFPTSYALVKPYVQGFEVNTLDAPSLKDVKIDNNWQPKKPNGES